MKKQGKLLMKWREQVEESMKRIGLRKKDVIDWYRWREGVGRVTEVVRCIWLPLSTGKI